MKLEDRRVRRTKQLIKQSLIELMHEKPFKDITVKDITERADLNRGTFYLHYVDIYGYSISVQLTQKLCLYIKIMVVLKKT